MSNSHGFSPDEEGGLAEALRHGRRAECPKCEIAMDTWPIRPRGDVSYVRDRIWLVCPSCRRTALIDRRNLD